MSEENQTLAALKDIDLTLAEVFEMPDSKSSVHRVLVVINGEPKILLKKDKSEYMDATVGDATASGALKVWDFVDRAKESFTPGSIWSIKVTKDSYNGNPQLTFVAGDSKNLGASIHEVHETIKEEVSQRLMRGYKPSTSFLLTLSARMINMNEASKSNPSFIVREVFGFKEDIDWAELFNHIIDAQRWRSDDEYSENILSDISIAKTPEFLELFMKDEISQANLIKFLTAPAAAGHHGNFLHGLTAHVEGMVEIVETMGKFALGGRSFLNIVKTGLHTDEEKTKMFSGKVDKDLLIVACYIHDYYKIEEYQWDDLGSISYVSDPAIFYHDMLMAFRLMNIKANLGLALTEKTIIDKLAMIVMTHHGQWAEFKPGKKATVYAESDIFHFVDNLEAKMTSAIERS